MRIGILTFPNSPSLGASLQMYALYHVLQGLGHEVEIMNYNAYNAVHGHEQPAKSLGMRNQIKRWIASYAVPGNKEAFLSFEDGLKKNPCEETASSQALIEMSGRYDRIVVGSDQVWNPHITGGDENYYLAFSRTREQKAAYAPSFGVDALEEDKKARIAELLNGFAHLSARERRGAEIIRELTGREAPVVLDPTLLLRAKDWEPIARPPRFRQGSYALYYAIKPSPSLKGFAQTWAYRRGLKLVTIGGRLRERFEPWRHPVFGAGPAEFLGLLQGAACVVTNSFHGLALAACLHRPLLVQYSSDTNSRLTGLVEQLALFGRVVSDPEDFREREETDFARVEAVLDTKREESMAYLRSVLRSEQ